MDSDFVTRQHIESLTDGDSSFREVLNRYKFAPGHSPTKNVNVAPTSFNGDAIMLSNMLGQIQAGVQRLNGTNSPSIGSDGFQLNINADILKWVVLLVLVLLIVWLFLRANKRRNPLSKKVEKLEEDISHLKKFQKKNPKALEAKDEVDDYEDYDEYEDDEY